MAKYLIIALLCLSCSQESNKLSGTDILNKSKNVHDPHEQWNHSILQLHIQEPRLSNPARYSKIKLDNSTGSFVLARNREEHESKHIIDKHGNAKTLLDDREETDTLLIKKYRLDPSRNKGYRDFYKMLYGLPMSLNTETVYQIGEVVKLPYNNHSCYKIPIELKEAMFSKNWQIYISSSDYTFKGMEIVFPEDQTKGERLYFDGTITVDSMRIPRIRHWHEYSNDAYSGSDIIVKKLQN